MFCPNCGTQLNDDSRFCSNCGAQIDAVREVHAAPEPTDERPMPPYVDPAGTAGNVADPAGPAGGPMPQMTYAPPVQNAYVPETPPQPVYPGQKDTMYVRRMPIILIIVLTLGFTINAWFTESTSMTLGLAASCVPGIVLIFLIFRMDRIEPEPVSLLVKCFFGGAILAVVGSMNIELLLEYAVSALFVPGTVMYCLVEAFILAATTEELCKYAVLKDYTWRHPAFNYRFDGVVYSTTVAIGFEIVENMLYLFDNTVGTALGRAAFPGHCVFGIYMGYYYGQAKSIELRGDVSGAAKMRKRGILTAVLIHGGYDFVCFLGASVEYEGLQILMGLAITAIMVVLNVMAYKSIKRYAVEDAQV